MRHASGFPVLGSIASRGGYGRLFRRACAFHHAADQGCAGYGRSGQHRRHYQTGEKAKAGETRAAPPGEIAAATACRLARTAAGRGTDTRTATARGEARTQARAKTQAEAKTEAKTKTRGKTGSKAACPTCSGGAQAKAKTKTAEGR